jgi:hypothetical protein
MLPNASSLIAALAFAVAVAFAVAFAVAVAVAVAVGVRSLTTRWESLKIYETSKIVMAIVATKISDMTPKTRMSRPLILRFIVISFVNLLPFANGITLFN